MKMFLRLGVFVFLGIVFLFVVGPADGQHSLYGGTAGGQTGYDIGDRVEVTFVVEPIDSVALYIEARGMNITSIVGATTTVNPIVPGTYSTDADSGLLVVTGTITPISGGTYISALWDRGAADDLLARADLPVLVSCSMGVSQIHRGVVSGPGRSCVFSKMSCALLKIQKFKEF